jgi:5-oxoprolinase (ATP-hydrolysing)
MDACWKFWVDVGGTFTDCIAIAPRGPSRRCKVLSSGRLRGTARWQQPPHLLHVDWPREMAPLVAGADVLAGYRCEFLGGQGETVATARVVRSGGATPIVELADFTPRLLAQSGLDPDPWDRAGFTVEFFSDELAPLLAIRLILGINPTQPIPRLDLRLGTTRGTNALLTRTGARTALLTTAGFADALEIGDQQRPDLFALDVRKTPPLYECVVEVPERLSAQGDVLRPLDQALTRQTLQRLVDAGIESVAVCLLHSYLNPLHERLIETLAQPLAFANVSLSHRCSPLIKFIPRASTTVLDAYLNPILQRYLRRIQGALTGDSQMLLMTSSGGLVGPDEFSGKDSVLSGPAGGVVGFSTVAREAGHWQAIGFDMGGTSTDVARCDGSVALQREIRKAGVVIQNPTLAIETVAAGGGSICGFDGQRLLVGPQSAGADPGPACYGRGGPLTVTDLNLWLGRLSPTHFPVPLDRTAVDQALAGRIAEIQATNGTVYTPTALASAYLAVANSHMAGAISAVSTQQGVDPRHYPLVAFGGAGGQHACGVADLLGCTQVLVHPDASLLSAFGIGHSAIQRIAQQHLDWPLDPDHIDRLIDVHRQLVETASRQLPPTPQSPTSHPKWIEQARLWIQVAGTDQSLTVDFTADRTAAQLRSDFWDHYHRRFGVRWDRPLRLMVLEVNLQVNPAPPATSPTDPQAADSEFSRVASGPQAIDFPNSTLWLEPNWVAERNRQGLVRLRRQPAAQAAGDPTAEWTFGAVDGDSPAHQGRDPLLLELFCHRMTEIATQMGLTLQATCTSVNVKERLDFSCAVFDADGNLLVNAPHIPVHLGAMSETVKSIQRHGGPFARHDVFVTNDPFQGGSHLPDVTVVTPVFLPTAATSDTKVDPVAAADTDRAAAEGTPQFWVASRAHHAEIGGITPGSMPPFAVNLEQEGVVLRNLRWFTAEGKINDEVEASLRSARFPSRSPETNLQDIQAQVAANRLGCQRLQSFVQQWGWPKVQAYCGHVQDSAAEHTRLLLRRLPAGTYTYRDQLDCGLQIQLQVTGDGDQWVFDFTGTDPARANNFNTNPAIVQSALLYCLRVMIAAPIPLNQGVLRPIRWILPPCFLNPLGSAGVAGAVVDSELPAVGGGNVETSQRIVDVVLGALQVAAASQGTMNNFLFGDHSFGFYETMGGGCGATAHAAGADAVHSHMTNTRLTDPEILETRYPVRLLEFRIRAGSGGAGQHRGGHGLVRRFLFLRPLQVSLVTNRRALEVPAPYGMHGGEAGQRGLNVWEDPSGRRTILPGSCQLEVQAGQIIEIQTPGGGGWGVPGPKKPT